MQRIPGERARAQWNAIRALSDERGDRLRDSFFGEQEAIMSVLIAASLPDVRTKEELEQLFSLEDPRGLGFAVIFNIAAGLAEMARRESGRPLRALTGDETTSIGRRLAEIYPTTDEVFARETWRDQLFNTCPQSDAFEAVWEELAAEGTTAEDYDELKRELIELVRFCLDCVDAAATHPDDSAFDPNANWTVDRIEWALSVQADPMRREALKAAESFRAELTPRLIAELDRWAAEPNEVAEEDTTFGIHALHLLAHWREASALPVFADVIRIPAFELESMDGGVMMEEGARLLASVVGERQDQILTLLNTVQVIDGKRWAIVDSLGCLVAWGECSREKAIEYLQELFKGVADDTEDDFWTAVVNLACNLEAWELMPQINEALDKNLVDEDVIDREHIVELRERPAGSIWQEYQESCKRVEDVAEATPWLDELPGDDDLDEDSESDDEGDGEAESETSLTQPVLPGLLAPYSPPPAEEPYVAPPKVGRNDPCPCGSGKKYKKCCG